MTNQQSTVVAPGSRKMSAKVQVHLSFFLLDLIVLVPLIWFATIFLNFQSEVLAETKYVSVFTGGLYAGLALVVPVMHIGAAVGLHTGRKELSKRILKYAFAVLPLGFLLGIPLSAHYRSLPVEHGYQLCSQRFESPGGFNYVWARPEQSCDGYKSWRKEQLGL